jgi:phospholipid N-methyltransferase
MSRDAALFFGLWPLKPPRIAAITQSSTRLASAMAQLIYQPAQVCACSAASADLVPETR